MNFGGSSPPVWPIFCQSVIAAREAGKMTALLRNPLDMQVIKGFDRNVSSALGLSGQIAGASAHGLFQVPVLYGGRNAKLPPDGLQLRSSQPSLAQKAPVESATVEQP